MWTESNTPSKIEGAGGADVPKALIYYVHRCHALREVVLVYKCGQEKLNNLYYQMKEQRR